MNIKKFPLALSIVLSASFLFTNIAFAETSLPKNTANAIRIDNKIVTITGTVVSKPTNDGVAYFLNTSDGSYGVIGPLAKSISSYANTDKKITVTGNPAVGAKIIVMTSFADYVPAAPSMASATKQTAQTSSAALAAVIQNTSNAIRIDNKTVTFTGTIVSKPTNDGVAYYLNTSDVSYGIIGPLAKSISSFANTDKKVTVTGNPAVGVKIIVMTSFSDYITASAKTKK